MICSKITFTCDNCKRNEVLDHWYDDEGAFKWKMKQKGWVVGEYFHYCDRCQPSVDYLIKRTLSYYGPLHSDVLHYLVSYTNNKGYYPKETIKASILNLAYKKELKLLEDRSVSLTSPESRMSQGYRTYEVFNDIYRIVGDCLGVDAVSLNLLRTYKFPLEFVVVHTSCQHTLSVLARLNEAILLSKPKIAVSIKKLVRPDEIPNPIAGLYWRSKRFV